MSEFEDNLWRDVVSEHGDDLDQMTWPPPRRRRPRPRVLAGTGAALAAVTGALVFVLGGAGTSPAYAVTANHDGSISLTINRLGGIRGANLKLSSLGVHAMAVQVPAACRAAITVARFNPRRIPPGKTLVIAAWRAGHEIRLSSARLGPAGAACMRPGPVLNAVKGEVPMASVPGRCTVTGPPVVAPPPGPVVAPGGSGTGTGTTLSTGTGTGTTPSTGTATATSPSTGSGTGTIQSTATGTGTTQTAGIGTGTGTSQSTGTGTTAPPGAASSRPLPTVAIPCGFQQHIHATTQQIHRAMALAAATRKRFGKLCNVTIGPPQQATVPSTESSKPPPFTVVQCQKPVRK